MVLHREILDGSNLERESKKYFLGLLETFESDAFGQSRSKKGSNMRKMF